jgi:hypothetical protein
VNEKHLQRKVYINRVSDKQQWFYKADGLLHAASFLKAEVQRFYDCLQRPPDQVDIQAISDDRLVEVYFMLVGCAFENLLKGVHIQRLKTSPIKGPKLPPEIKTHNVLCLAQKLGMKLGKREEDLLKRLEVVVARGRYPVPTDYSQIIPFGKKPDDLKIAESLLAKLKQLRS